MKSLYIKAFYCLTLLFLSASCGVNSNIMFKSPKGKNGNVSSNQVNLDSISKLPTTDFKISRDDKITFTISNNFGHKIIENQTGVTNQGNGSQRELEYLVKSNGYVELPVIGDVHVEGLTIKQCEDTLAKLYSKEHQTPFVQVKVTNQRVIVFPGDGSDAKVIPLRNNNTTLMEAIAEAGGITNRGRANRIKLIRKVDGVRKIFVIDLSKEEGLQFTDLIVQSNDYIYVEPNPRLAQEVVAQIAPFASLVGSLVVVLTVLSRVK